MIADVGFTLEAYVGFVEAVGCDRETLVYGRESWNVEDLGEFVLFVLWTVEVRLI